MSQGNPLPGEKYLHFKNKMYQVVTVAYHSETMERYVVYQALYGDFRTYVRPLETFISEVDHEKYPLVKQKYRFQYLADGSAPEPGAEELSERSDRSAAGSAVPGADAASGSGAPGKDSVAGSAAPAENSASGSGAPGKDSFSGSGVSAENSASSSGAPGKDSAAGSAAAAESSDSGNAALGKDSFSGSAASAENSIFRSAVSREDLPGRPPADSQPVSAESQEGLPEGANPWLLRFLDAESYEEKYKIVCDLCRDVDDKLIDDIAVVMDVAIPEGRLEERYIQLKNSIRIRLRYEQTRLR